MSYGNDWDVIDYDWKSFDLDQEIHTIALNRNYAINDSKGRIYLLRFLDFYNSNGIKGAPSFEYVRLK